MIVFVIGVLSIPIDVYFESKKDLTSYNRLEVRWLFGIIHFDPFQKKKNHKLPTPKTNKDKEKTNLTFIRRVISNRSMKKRIFSFLWDILHAIRLKRGYITLEFGHSDPAETAIILGKLYAAQYALIDPTESYIKIIPNFTQEVFYWDGQGLIRLFPAEIISKFLKFILSPTIWRNIYVSRFA